MMPGPNLDAASLLEDLEQEEVTLTAGVPTVFLAVLQALDAEPERYDLSKLRTMVIGGSAAPKGVIRDYKERHGIEVLHAWGMTEMSPIGTVANLTTEMKKLPEEQLEYEAKQGYPVPFVEIRARGAEGFVPWDGETMGELEVRGPWVASSYYEAPEGDDKFTDDGWFKTGDVVTIDRFGFIKITDRSKDLIKSGGVDLLGRAGERAYGPSCGLPGLRNRHPAREVGRETPGRHRPQGRRARRRTNCTPTWKWTSPRFWLPDAYEFVEAIPMTATGKFQKLKLREQFEGYTSPKS